MDLTSKKNIDSDTNCFIYSDAVTSKQRVRVFKSGSKGKSSVDLHRLINKALADKLNIFVRHGTLRAMPLLRPCAFRLSGAAW